MARHFHRYIVFWLILAIFIPSLSGCDIKNAGQPLSASAIKLNTFVTVKIYDNKKQSILDHCMEMIDQYELLFSRTNPESELYQLNEQQSGSDGLSAPLQDVIQIGLDYSAASSGAFDIAIEPVSSLWDFTAEHPVPPDPAAIQAALPYVNASGIHLQDGRITFDDPHMGIDLGGIAKGYIADRLKDYLLSEGVNSAMINLGGNVLCVGTKPDGSPFEIGIQKPFSERNEVIATIPVTDQSVVSSGVYERYFDYEGVRYHHLLDPATGYPVKNNLLEVTILSDLSVDGDALSTTCFVLGLEKGMELIESLPGAEAMFITDDNQLHYSSGFPKI